MDWAFAFARIRAGNSKLARIAIIAMTTRSSIRVNPLERRPRCDLGDFIAFIVREAFTRRPASRQLSVWPPTYPLARGITWAPCIPLQRMLTRPRDRIQFVAGDFGLWRGARRGA